MTSNILIVGDGPLAYEMALLARESGHSVTTFLYNESGGESDNPLLQLPAFIREVADTTGLVVEAVISNRGAKKFVMQAINDGFLGMEEPILSATLNASATEVGSWLIQPGTVVGWAGLPPMAESKVFELMPGLHSSADSIDRASEFLSSLGKDPVTIADTPGGVLPRVVANLVNEAAMALMEGVADAEDIDRGMQLGTSYPHGPLAWGDMIGLDQVQGILNALGATFGTGQYQPALLLQQLVHAGFWGERTGQGFYEYGD